MHSIRSEWAILPSCLRGAGAHSFPLCKCTGLSFRKVERLRHDTPEWVLCGNFQLPDRNLLKANDYRKNLIPLVAVRQPRR